MSDDLAFTPALDLVRLLRGGQVSPAELVEVFLRRIEQANPRLGAYVTVAAGTARAEAAAGAAGALAGLPLSIKDLHATAGITTTMGAACLRGHVPDSDDHTVGLLRGAGAVVLGKTTAPMFGLGCVSEPYGFPPARNPWDPRRTPGGSSGGAGAAVAAGLCAAAHGSDGGGSIRIPAAWCGVVGLKPSRGRVSLAPKPSSLTGTEGPLTRTVADAALLLDVMAGPVLGDAFWAPPPQRSFTAQLDEPLGRLRVGVAFGERAVAAPIRDAVERVAGLLADAGHAVSHHEPVARWAHPIEDFMPRSGAGYRAALAELPTTEDLDPLVAAAAEHTEGISADDHVAAQGEMLARARRATESFATVDLLLTPTVAKPPPLVGEHRELAFEELFVTWESYVPFTTMWNWSGQPAISVPAGFDDEGLPLGVQLVARPAEEGLLLRAAALVEQALALPAQVPDLEVPA